MAVEDPRVGSVKRDARRGGASRRPWIAVGALALVVMASLGTPRAARAAEPSNGLSVPGTPARLEGAVAPVAFVCRIPHAAASSALGVFATSLTLWTRVSDADPAHVAAVVWLEPSLVGAVYGIDLAGAPSVPAASEGRQWRGSAADMGAGV